MSILQEYEEIREKIGHKKYDAISEYLEEICPEETRTKYQNEILELNGLNALEWLEKRKEIEKKYNIVLLSDVLYDRKEWEKFDKWYQQKLQYKINEDKTRKLENGMYVIDLGYRKEQPIALVKRISGKYTEYIIGFNYEIKDNKMEWGYGYYYGDNLEKAKEDFKKVLAGNYLDDTFTKSEEKKDKHKNKKKDRGAR